MRHDPGKQMQEQDLDAQGVRDIDQQTMQITVESQMFAAIRTSLRLDILAPGVIAAFREIIRVIPFQFERAIGAALQ